MVTDIFAALASSGLGVAYASLDGTFLDVNPSFCRILGYSREELVGHRFSEISHPDDDWENSGGLRHLVSGHVPGFRVEQRYLRKDKTVIWVSLLALLVRDEKNAPGNVVCLVEDITGRKQLESDKQAIELRYKTLFNQLPDSVVLVDADTRIIGFNDEALRVYEYTPEEILRLRITDISVMYNEAQVQEIERRIMETGQHDFFSRHRTKSGRILDIKVSVRTIRLPEGQIVFQCVFHDITAIKQTERALTQEKANLNAILDNIPHLLWLKDTDGRYIAVNMPHVISAGRADPRELLGKTDFDIWPRELAEKFRADDAEVMATRKRKQLEEYVLDKGRYIWVETNKTPIMDKDGKVLGTVGFARDITESRRAAEALRQSEERLRQATRASRTGIFDHDHVTNTLYWSPELREIFGRKADEPATFEAFIAHIHPGDKERVTAVIRNAQDTAASGGDGLFVIEFRLVRTDGGTRWLISRSQVLFEGKGAARRLIRTIGAVVDITERKRQDELIWTQANYDPLTNLPNRRLFQDRLEVEIRKSHRTGTPIALLLIDLDRFKEINDTLGHVKGDVLLVEAARRISACVRDADTVARLGGDEFTVILPEFGDTADVERVAQKIIQELSKPFSLGGKDFGCLGEKDFGYISATIGITLYPNDAQDFDSLMKHVDQAMYRAKGEGRSRFGYFTPSMQQEAQEKRALTDDLRNALAKRELRVFYQPIVDMKNRKIVKAEALLRWQHPARGMIGPDVFIPLAEESLLIVDIGEWVFREACDSVDRWRQRFGDIIQVSINKSPVQFEFPVDKPWADLLERRGLPGNSITVEITEGLLLKESPKVKQRLLEFRNSGIEVSIDDFGTGFSSLSYLKQFDIDYLKIDRSFVRFLTEDESDMALVEAIIVMARKLGIRTVAEGVETQDQHDLLASFGCDYAQGFLYSPAVPSQEFVQLLGD